VNPLRQQPIIEKVMKAIKHNDFFVQCCALIILFEFSFFILNNSAMMLWFWLIFFALFTVMQLEKHKNFSQLTCFNRVKQLYANVVKS